MRQFTDYFQVMTLLLLLLLGAANRNRLAPSLPLAARHLASQTNQNRPQPATWWQASPKPALAQQFIMQAQPL
ncbi:hypothetical protein HNQ93_001489 [Hymenobacter luteus]|uniref:Uncharacterized protein n=2 Tax=Hymenobacter TaxID=89966 RepID=A0A7W9WB52_9BACT|nr:MULTISPECIES: hypothetical protein [Hymenobacter]MBB4601150.1 hypothetical protein [Hymenobacter latericoloratus]MBB6058643.1 hypothetical protein [Hymenobacter luteus]